MQKQKSNDVLCIERVILLSIIGIILTLITSFYPITGDSNSIGITRLNVNKDYIHVTTNRFGPEGTDYVSSKSEFARLVFALDADFTPIFDWNTKQIFITVAAEYQTHHYGRNLVSIWDKIITRKEDAHLLLDDVTNKYALVDISNRWSFENVHLSLFWDKTPYFGTLQSGKFNNGSSFIIPPFTQIIT